MIDHTKGPWHAGGDGTIIYAEDGWGVASTSVMHVRHNGKEEAKSNARRIVACVNACSDISQQYLEELNGESLIRKQLDLILQRDQLLAALRDSLKFVDAHRRASGGDGDIPAMNARAAIASVEQTKPCEHCDGTGDVHRADGEWLGECDCIKAVKLDAENNDSRRVAACLKACEGIHIDTLESQIHGSAKYMNECARLERKCDGLLRALKQVQQDIDNGGVLMADTAVFVESVIAKATGGAA